MYANDRVAELHQGANVCTCCLHIYALPFIVFREQDAQTSFVVQVTELNSFWTTKMWRFSLKCGDFFRGLLVNDVSPASSNEMNLLLGAV